MPGQDAPFYEPRHDQIRVKAQRLSTSRLEPLEERAADDLAGTARRSMRILGASGLLRHVVPKSHGGASPTVEVRAIAAAREGIAYGSGMADALVALQGLGAVPIALAGSDDQKNEWLPNIARGRAIAAFAVTEPDAGSDIASMTTRAKPTPRGWEINGEKRFISNAGIADYYVLFAKTDPGAGHKGISAFLVPAHARGIRVEPIELLAQHPIGAVRLTGVRVGRDALIGAPGDGFKIALATLDTMRPTVAAAACGMARRALDEAIRRAQKRLQFGKPLAEHQGLRWKLAEAATDLDAARLLMQRAAWRKDHGQERITVEAAQAKLFATEAAQRIIDVALQVHGGQGVVAGTPVERLYRDIRALRIYEGTSEILRDVIGRALTGPAPGQTVAAPRLRRGGPPHRTTTRIQKT